MSEIECIDRDGNVDVFIYRYEKDKLDNNYIWDFNIFPKGDSNIDSFSFSATEINLNTIKVTMMKHQEEVIYKAKGIPEKMIEELYKITNKTIISSTNNPKAKILAEEFRTPQASKVWERLLNNEKAVYDIKNDIYTLKVGGNG